MCGRFNLRANLRAILNQFAVTSCELRDLSPRYNIAPSQRIPVVRRTDSGRELALLSWGLIPSWSKDPKIAYRTINARADTVAEKPAFRSAFKKRRCLIPADGYYEWLREGKTKQPFVFEPRNGKPFAFAGLWESWLRPDGTPLESFTVITTEANALAAEVHDRMPVILPDVAQEPWLDPSREASELKELLVPYPATEMSCRPVSTFVNNASHEGEECLQTP